MRKCQRCGATVEDEHAELFFVRLEFVDIDGDLCLEERPSPICMDCIDEIVAVMNRNPGDLTT